jgi:hypothetical protein
MKKVFLLLCKSVINGIEPHWRILSEDKTEAVKADGNFESKSGGKYMEFYTYSEAKRYCKANKLKIAGETQVTYSLANGVMNVYLDNAVDVEYSDVKNDRQAQNLLKENYPLL